jgi:Terminase large subunit, T4likevirus-type, N-terminal
MVMARANVGRRLARLRSQAEMVLSLRQRVTPDTLAIMQASGLPPDPWQAELFQAEASRILMLCARQTGKSTVAASLALSEALPRPSLVLLLSPSLRQSQELFRKVLDLYRCQQAVVPTDQESALRLELMNGSRIISLPGKEETIRGYSGVRLLIVDEAARVPDALYYSVRPMLAVSGGRLVCLSTPFGKRGFFFQEWIAGEGWHKVKVTAEQCPRISPVFLAEERRSLGEWWYRQEYLCEFSDAIDQVFAYDDIMAAFTTDVTPLFAAAVSECVASEPEVTPLFQEGMT